MAETIRAYAKINLGLRILGKRTDGFHEIETVLHRIDLFDEIQLEEWDGIEVVSDSPEAPSGKDNLCHRAVRLLQKHYGQNRGVKIHLVKKIPVGAGLGGGSSDAAAVLRSVCLLWGIPENNDVLSRLGAELGSDVPFFLSPGTAVASGRGEILEYLPFVLPYAVVLAVPEIHISTEWAYRSLHLSGPATAGNLAALLKEGRLLTPEGIRNDFEPTVFHSFPAIREIKELMLAHGAVGSSLTGTGSGVFGLFRDSSAAIQTSHILAPMGLRTTVTPPLFAPDA